MDWSSSTSENHFPVHRRVGPRPVIASVAAVPTSAMPNGEVNITAQATDNAGVATVNAHVIGPGVDVNLTMNPGSGATWYVRRTYANLGSYAFTVWAADGTGNVASGSGPFSIAQSTPPPAPSGVVAHVQSDGAIMVMWSPGTSGSVAGYNVYRSTSVGGPFTKLTSTPVPASGPLEYLDSDVAPGTTSYDAVTAVDASGNESPLSTPASATVSGSTPPTSDYTLWIVLAIVLAVLGIASIVVVRRRKR